MRKFTMNYFVPAVLAVIAGLAAALLLLTFLALFLYALVQPVQADVGDVWVSPYSFTQHYKVAGYCADRLAPPCLPGDYRKFQNSHPSLGIEYQDAQSRSIAAGVYRDSYGGTSVYFARHWRYGYGLGATMGVLAGPSYPHKFVPFLGPEISVQVQSVKASLAYMPNFGIPNQPSITVLQVAVKVW